jgi:hypothetical protein
LIYSDVFSGGSAEDVQAVAAMSFDADLSSIDSTSKQQRAKILADKFRCSVWYTKYVSG